MTDRPNITSADLAAWRAAHALASGAVTTENAAAVNAARDALEAAMPRLIAEVERLQAEIETLEYEWKEHVCHADE